MIFIDTKNVNEPKQKNIQHLLKEMDQPGYNGKPKVTTSCVLLLQGVSIVSVV